MEFRRHRDGPACGQSFPHGGDLDSTEILFRRMRAEDHPPRKSDGNNHNCGHAARSRSLNPCERPLRSACGPGVDVISAGWPLTVVPDVGGEIFWGWLPGGSGRFFTPGATLQKRIRIVDSCGDVFSDPGANPGASTISKYLTEPHLRLSQFPPSGVECRRAHDLSAAHS